MKSLLKFSLVLMGVAMGVILIVVLISSRKEPQKLVPPTYMEAEPTKMVAAPILKFGVMADVHNDLNSLQNFLDVSKQRGEEFVIIDGDLTINGSLKELSAVKKTLDESGVRYYAVPGNHDHWGSRDRVGLYAQMFGEDYQSFKEGGAKFILVNNGSWRGLGEVQRNWLEGEVGECRQIKCIIMMHMPLNHNFSGHVMGEDSDKVTAEARELIELFVANNIKEVITGHLHYSTSYELGGLRTTIVGAVSKDRNTQTSRYTEFAISDGDLKNEVIKAD